ncbi:MAG: hypothetical protein IPF82_16355 [Blastocatellia bacterium]|nr:hypothetical protein [Blastocatellia bacterium]
MRTFMAHHEGMALLALAGRFSAAASKARFHAEPAVIASSSSSAAQPRLVIDPVWS